MIGFIIYCIGAIIAFRQLCKLFPDRENPKDTGMIVIGSLLSWVSVIFIFCYGKVK